MKTTVRSKPMISRRNVLRGLAGLAMVGTAGIICHTQRERQILYDLEQNRINETAARYTDGQRWLFVVGESHAGPDTRSPEGHPLKLIFSLLEHGHPDAIFLEGVEGKITRADLEKYEQERRIAAAEFDPQSVLFLLPTGYSPVIRYDGMIDSVILGRGFYHGISAGLHVALELQQYHPDQAAKISMYGFEDMERYKHIADIGEYIFLKEGMDGINYLVDLVQNGRQLPPTPPGRMPAETYWYLLQHPSALERAQYSGRELLRKVEQRNDLTRIPQDDFFDHHARDLRDRICVENTLHMMDEQEYDVGLIVIGKEHLKGIRQLLEQQGFRALPLLYKMGTDHFVVYPSGLFETD